MKKLVTLLFFIISINSYSQMDASWHQGKEKYVCAAYGYGKFTGSNGKRHKYVPYGKKKVKGRSRIGLYKAARRKFIKK